jgi:hypothetical protein
MIELASELAQGHRAAGPLAKCLLLLGPRAATLDQDNQDDDNQNTSSNPNDRGTVHSNSSFLKQDTECARRLERNESRAGSPGEKISDRLQLRICQQSETPRSR